MKFVTCLGDHGDYMLVPLSKVIEVLREDRDERHSIVVTMNPDGTKNWYECYNPENGIIKLAGCIVEL